MTTIVPFKHEGSTVRTATAGGQPWFILSDVCLALDLGIPAHRAVALLDASASTSLKVGEGPAAQRNAAVNEQGLLALALRADGLLGRAGKRWLLDQVLPAAKQLAGLAGPTEPLTIEATSTRDRGAATAIPPADPLPLRDPEVAPAPSPVPGRAVVSTGQVAAGAGGIMPFAFEGRPVRVVTRDGEPWFVLADVCRVLEIGNPSDAARRLDDDEKHTLDSVEGIASARVQALTVVNESGLWSLVLTSRKPEAKRFKRWITGEVIPAIRKTGGYMLARPDETPEELMARALKVAQATIDRTTAQLAAAAPKVAALERIEGAEGSMCVTDAGKVLGLGQREAFALMQKHGWLYKRTGGQSWLGFQDKVTAGLLEHRVMLVVVDGRETSRSQVLVTAKGMARLAQLLTPVGAA